ncbi:MAG: hypothetical protein RLZZ189_593 [Pseudomonadota bacterium]|jgi:hypothetical protein
METFIVYLDDKQYALQQIVPMLSHQEASQQVSWVLVGCPPRLTRHSGRWLSQSAQKKWRQDWTQETTQEIATLLKQHNNQVFIKTAHGPLTEFTKKLSREFVSARVIDARRPKLTANLHPVTDDQPQAKSDLVVPAGILAIGASIAMVAD